MLQVLCAEQYGPELVKSNLTSLYIDPDVLPHYNVSDVTELHCCYRTFWRYQGKERGVCEYPGGVDSRTE